MHTAHTCTCHWPWTCRHNASKAALAGHIMTWEESSARCEAVSACFKCRRGPWQCSVMPAYSQPVSKFFPLHARCLVGPHGSLVNHKTHAQLHNYLPATFTGSTLALTGSEPTFSSDEQLGVIIPFPIKRTHARMHASRCTIMVD